MVAVTPAVLAEGCGLVFEPGVDELGEYALAAIEYQGDHYDRLQAWLIHRANAPTVGLEVHIDSRASATTAVSRLVRLLNLDPASIAWSAEPSAGESVSGSKKAKAG